MSERLPQKRSSCYTSHEVSSLCGVAPITVARWIEAGKLKAFRTVGGHRRIMQEDLDSFLAEFGIPRSDSVPDEERRVLVVDDDEIMFKVLRDMIALLEGRWNVQWAPDGFEAGRRVESFRPQLLFLDLMMPGMDGFEVCRRIKSEPRTGVCEIVGLTGYFTPENRSRLMECGALELLRKPLDFETLKKTLSKVFEVSLP